MLWFNIVGFLQILYSTLVNIFVCAVLMNNKNFSSVMSSVLQECEFTVRVSFLEIYNEELIDLLGAESVENPRLKIYEDAGKKVQYC